MSLMTDLVGNLTGVILPTVNPNPAQPGWLLCDGAAVSRETYARLFAVIGTTFGVGDGSTTFNVPDLRGRTVVGTGQGAGLSNRALAASGGAENHTLSADEMPSHGHPVRRANTTQSPVSAQTTGGYLTNTSGGTTDAAFTGTPSATAGHQIGGAGGGSAHNNMQPFVALHYIIKA